MAACWLPVVFQEEFSITTNGRGTTDITDRVRDSVRRSGIRAGICQVFVRHTSASLIVCENADADVRHDLDRFFSRLVPDGEPSFRHVAEGADDMPAHVRAVLTGATVSLPVMDGHCLLGIWQGLYLWEHRLQGSVRGLVVTLVGEP